MGTSAVFYEGVENGLVKNLLILKENMFSPSRKYGKKTKDIEK